MVNKLRFNIRTVLSIAIIIVCVTLKVNAITDISSIPTGNTTWSDDTIRVMNSLTIDENSVLTIDPGTVVSFQGKYKLIVRGTLIAQGTIADSIVFTAINEIPGWHGIRFINTNPAADSSIISFCRIQYGYASSGLMPDNPTNDDRGGAFYIDGFSKIRISNCLITNNKADDKGGAMFLYDGANPIIRNNTIVYNESYADAAGIACFLNCSPRITYNEIAFNTSIDTTIHPAEGGGIFCRDNSNAYISRNNIHHNYADYGGGIWITGSAPNIINNTIAYNECVSETELCLGAGILVKEDAAPKIVSNTICNNYTSYAGGGIFLKDTAMAFISNNLICNNQSDSLGAGFFISNNSNAKIYNNTIANNHCVANGGAFRISASNPELVNNIIWGNTATLGNQIYLADDASDPFILRCFVQGGKGDFGGSGSGISYEGSYIENIDFNPFFINPSESSGTGYDGLNADWAITAESPAIDNGYDSFNVDSVQTSIDVYGQTRFYNTIIDIGASEFQGDGSREYIFKDIYSNTVWSDSLYVISDIIIDSAALLTVQQNAYINF
ncbi:MAG: right-handed parallel beta-helix repeat-containing protein, partial [Bacteroidales bacterium]|nr:right-handed parallel beta-helix repeat-containing protein [Bacteroidales bacterium]